MDHNQFLRSCEKVINAEVTREGIGTLSEKTLHAVLKNYFEPDETYHEIKIGKHYADIYNEHGIIEIQTRQFNKLRSKLDVFLQAYQVTVVYPIPCEKMLYWVDEATGEISKGRKSPKRGNAYAIFPELYKIKSVLKHKNIRFCIALVNIEEYRLLNGWSKDRKKGSSCNDRIPTMLMEEIYLNSTEDYKRFIPDTLPEQFDSKEFAKSAKISISLAQIVLNILTEVHAVERVGKRSRSILYEAVAGKNEAVAKKDEVVAKKNEVTIRKNEVVAKKEIITSQKNAEVVTEKQKIASRKYDIVKQNEEVLTKRKKKKITAKKDKAVIEKNEVITKNG